MAHLGSSATTAARKIRQNMARILLRLDFDPYLQESYQVTHSNTIPFVKEGASVSLASQNPIKVQTSSGVTIYSMISRSDSAGLCQPRACFLLLVGLPGVGFESIGVEIGRRDGGVYEKH